MFGLSWLIGDDDVLPDIPVLATTNSIFSTTSVIDSIPEDVNSQEEAFYHAVRELIVCLLFLMASYAFSYYVISKYKTKTEKDDFYAGDEGDLLVYRISVWIASFSGAVSVCAILLLPVSIFGNEIMLTYPNNVFFSWLNSSLVQSLWNYVFLCTNLCIFILLPFSYFFIESQGFSGLRKGIMTRVYEAVCLCVLLIVIIICLVNMVSIMLDEQRARQVALFKIWNYQLPFIYSCMSLMGVALLLISTPVGLARMFTFIGGYVLKPRLVTDIDTDLMVTRLEQMNIQRKLDLAMHNNNNNNIHSTSDKTASSPYHQLACVEQHYLNGSNGGVMSQRLLDLSKLRTQLERQKRSSSRWLHNLKYPIVMLLLLTLTVILVALVVINTLQLLIGLRSLPAYKQYMELGHRSLSALGIVGAVLDCVLIFHVIFASFVGFYRLPILGRLKPRRGQTSMTKLIFNCGMMLILSSALPVLTRTLGISSFDLLGNYSKLEWLSNFYLVLGYNVVFAVATGVCLVTKFTSAIRSELYKRFNEVAASASGSNTRQRHPSSISRLDSHLIGQSGDDRKSALLVMDALGSTEEASSGVSEDESSSGLVVTSSGDSNHAKSE